LKMQTHFFQFGCDNMLKLNCNNSDKHFCRHKIS
jgi:hypothetical protein